MRVGFDARWYNDSGVGVYVLELVRALAASAKDFDLIVYEDPSNPLPNMEGAGCERVPLYSPKYSFAGQVELRQRARRDKIDVFHSPFYAAPLILSCPMVVTVHDLIPFLFPIYPWPKQWLVKMGYRMAARRAKHILADSRNTATDVHNILGIPEARISTIHIAAQSCFKPEGDERELERLKEKFGVRPPYVVAASARNWRTKNLGSALRALEVARRETGIEFQSVVYGPIDGLQALGSSSDAWQAIKLRPTGYVEAEDLAMFFRNAHAFILPSLYEGFGLPVLEALSCGCAVVASKAGSIAEVAGDGAQLFDPFDIEGMARAVTALLCNSEELRRWKVSALVRAKHFSWSQAALQTISVYHRTQVS
jgi:glycosyltransferase involved in cell wall biosynthesis